MHVSLNCRGGSSSRIRYTIIPTRRYVLCTGQATGTRVMSPDDLADKRPGATRTVFDVLKEKHPGPGSVARDPNIDALITRDEAPESAFESVTVDDVKNCVRNLDSAGGPSKVDGKVLRDLCTKQGAQSDRLNQAIANLTNYVAQKVVPWRK